ncbi:hypothetical protein HAX54_047002, partial [Datura stramonium]|nr:hypothetical protein [Datura stramonium]
IIKENQDYNFSPNHKQIQVEVLEVTGDISMDLVMCCEFTTLSTLKIEKIAWT